MTPRRFKCTQFRNGTLDFILECMNCCKMISVKYITFNAIIPGQDRIYPNTHLCRTSLLGICGRRGGLVVERRTPEREVGGSMLTQVAVLCP